MCMLRLMVKAFKFDGCQEGSKTGAPTLGLGFRRDPRFSPRPSVHRHLRRSNLRGSRKGQGGVRGPLPSLCAQNPRPCGARQYGQHRLAWHCRVRPAARASDARHFSHEVGGTSSRCSVDANSSWLLRVHCPWPSSIKPAAKAIKSNSRSSVTKFGCDGEQLFGAGLVPIGAHGRERVALEKLGNQHLVFPAVGVESSQQR